MPEIENLQDSAQHCFELASQAPSWKRILP